MSHQAAPPALVSAFVNRRHAEIDPRLDELLRVLHERRAAECWHKHGTFVEHLYNVYRILRIWGQGDLICHTGLFHSAYSNELVDLAIFRPNTERDVLRNLLGPQTEQLIYDFCVLPRSCFIEVVAALDELPPELTISDVGTTVTLDPINVRRFIVLSIADLLEQWFDWQDETWRGRFHFPPTEDDSTVIVWPGAFRQTCGMLHTLSRMALHLRDTTPLPIFDGCQQVISYDAEFRCREAYETAMRVAATNPDIALAAAEDAQRHNPFVPEPLLVQAQLLMHRQRFDEAAAAALKGFDLLCVWGTPHDKRMGWEAWLAWSRVLHEHAVNRRWPTRRVQHNRLGLVGRG
jgi:hypothetical protein